MNHDLIDFNSLHKRLQELMNHELAALRIILDLMKEEEIALINNSTSTQKKLSLEKTGTNKKLKQLQKERSFLIKTLGRHFCKEHKIYHFNSSSFNIMISKDEENSVETFHLRDQILHFMKIIKQQKERLACLKKQGDSPLFLQLSTPSPQLQKKKSQTLCQNTTTED